MATDRLLVGRDVLISELRTAVAAASAGRGALFLLEGEAGIGKSTVTRAIASEAATQLSVSWGACASDGGAPPFWPWSDLVDAIDRSTTGSSDLNGLTRYERLSSIRDDILRRAASTPTVHIIEDLQWADVASVLLLGHLAPSVGRASLLVIATLRTGEPKSAALAAALTDVRSLSEQRELHPLGRDDVSTLIRRAGLPPEGGLADLVMTRTGGNPLFISELLRAVGSQTGPPTATLAADVPHRVAELVARRLATLPGAVTDLLATAAVLGCRGQAHAIAEVHGCRVASTLELLEQARAVQILEPIRAGTWQFRHEIVRDAVYEALADVERSQLHARVLEVLARDPSSPPAVLAAHAVAAVPLFDPERAVALAARAGEVAFDQTGFEEALGWFDRALAIAPAQTPSRWRAELLVLSGEAARHMGDRNRSQRSFLAAADLCDDPTLVARAALGYADPGADFGIAYRSEDPTTARLLDRAISLQLESDSTIAVLLQARLAAELYFSDEPGRSRDIAGRACAMATRLGDPRSLGAAMAVHHDAFLVGQADIKTRLDGSQQLVEWAGACAAPTSLLAARRARVFDLLAAGDMPAVQREIVAFRRISDPLHVTAYEWWPTIWSAMHALLECRHAKAEELALAAYQIGRRPFPQLALVNLSFFLFFLRREQGRLGELEETVRDITASQADVPALQVSLVFLLAELRRTDEASGRLADIDGAALDRLRDRNWPAAWFQLARATFLTADHVRAQMLLDLERMVHERCITVSLATVCLGAADLGRAWLCHTVGDLDLAERHYKNAEALNARIGARSWLAQTRLDRARLLLDRDNAGDRDTAGLLIAQSAEAATELDLASVADDLRQLQSRDAEPSDANHSTQVVGPGQGRGQGQHGSFRRAGDLWELAYIGHVVRVPHARGLQDLAFLLARPGRPVAATELIGTTPGSAVPSPVRGAATLDERARKEISQRLADLDTDIDEAEADHDDERAARARAQRQGIIEFVTKDLGIGGRARRLDDEAERARKTVSTRIRRAIAHVARAHPELGRHLDRSVDTGTWCAYRPEDPMTWQL